MRTCGFTEWSGRIDADVRQGIHHDLHLIGIDTSAVGQGERIGDRAGKTGRQRDGRRRHVRGAQVGRRTGGARPVVHRVGGDAIGASAQLERRRALANGQVAAGICSGTGRAATVEIVCAGSAPGQGKTRGRSGEVVDQEVVPLTGLNDQRIDKTVARSIFGIVAGSRRQSGGAGRSGPGTTDRAAQVAATDIGSENGEVVVRGSIRGDREGQLLIGRRGRIDLEIIPGRVVLQGGQAACTITGRRKIIHAGPRRGEGDGVVSANDHCLIAVDRTDRAIRGHDHVRRSGIGRAGALSDDQGVHPGVARAGAGDDRIFEGGAKAGAGPLVSGSGYGRAVELDGVARADRRVGGNRGGKVGDVIDRNAVEGSADGIAHRVDHSGQREGGRLRDEQAQFHRVVSRRVKDVAVVVLERNQIYASCRKGEVDACRSYRSANGTSTTADRLSGERPVVEGGKKQKE